MSKQHELRAYVIRLRRHLDRAWSAEEVDRIQVRWSRLSRVMKLRALYDPNITEEQRNMRQAAAVVTSRYVLEDCAERQAILAI
jgi:hypothetical protein